jgi:hypothetical protein
MIVLGGSNSQANMLHVVLGPESTFWMGLHGAMLSNITPVLNAMDPALPVYIHVSRCESETQMSEVLAAQAALNNPYPFHVLPNVFIPKNASSKTPAQPHVKPAADPTKTPAQPQSQPQPANVVTLQKGKCVRCGGQRKELVPKVDPAICYDCLHLDLMLAASRRDIPVQERPDEPPTDQSPTSQPQ